MPKNQHKEWEIRTKPLHDSDQHEWTKITQYGLMRKKNKTSEKDNPNASTTAVVDIDTGNDHNKPQDEGQKKRLGFRLGSMRDKLVGNITLMAAGAEFNNPSAYEPGKWEKKVRVKKGTKPKDPSSEWLTQRFCGMKIKSKPKHKSSSTRAHHRSDLGTAPQDARHDQDGKPPDKRDGGF